MATDTSWEKSSHWYHKSLGDKGDYYHQNIVIPNSLLLLNLQNNSLLLDLACGQGVFARAIPPTVKYLGLDISPSLIKEAQKLSHHTFQVADVSQPLNQLALQPFSHAAIILALQNVENAEITIKNAYDHLRESGKLLLVLNHPCFRIPRQSSWEIDPQNKIEFRRINRYLSPLKIPINTHPGQANSPITWSFHYPLSYYFQMLQRTGFITLTVEEWTSDKESKGKASRMENRARSEFPLFLAILAQKI